MKINVTIPVLNEQARLGNAIRTLTRWVADHPGGHIWEIIIADNGSTDKTPELGRACAEGCAFVKYLRIEERGRGQALAAAWLGSGAEILTYMDVDLSTDLSALPFMVESLAEGRVDIAIGSRLCPEAQTTRSLGREIVSRAYNRLVRLSFGTRILDLQCGFKSMSASAARSLLPEVEDRGWFWDSELLLIAERRGWRILEFPVRWVEDRDSRVAICRTAWRNLRGLARLRRKFRAEGIAKTR